ncbi:glycosyltransferase [Prosthecobacter sp.]|uniref:glycosyltransferase family 2 protein n=1 Tax=Prosthecobacter sp. TaxID=1965333 RepID=UPI001D9AD161|nr:glycosyltransferase [Prosthecobacter sp.]MCB1276981.1 glycosyltransferase [Prosthecobacter sp.]
MFVSILIPCHNAERWISQCIESALAQTWQDKEVIVLDDGSTDGSLEIIRSFGDRIRVETGPNRGGNAARNRLLQLARGEWLQYLDADDYLLPDKIEKQVQFLATRPEVDVAFSRYIQETHRDGQVQQAVGMMPEPRDDPWILLLRWDLSQTGALLWRKQAVLDAGGWKVDQPCCQEHELYLRMLEVGKRFEYCDDVGAVYRQWESGSVCTRNPVESHHRRLEIVQRAKNYLKAQDMLTPERLWAANQARLEVARIVWQYDQVRAADIARVIHRSQPTFLPDGPGRRIHYGLGYRLGYRLLGFEGAEKLAGWGRQLLKRKAFFS